MDQGRRSGGGAVPGELRDSVRFGLLTRVGPHGWVNKAAVRKIISFGQKHALIFSFYGSPSLSPLLIPTGGFNVRDTVNPI